MDSVSDGRIFKPHGLSDFSNTQPCGLRASGGTAAIRFGAGEAWGAHFAAACHYAEHPETLARFVWDSEPFWVGHAMVDAWVMRPIAPSNLIRE
jgi:hypothetical protein